MSFLSRVRLAWWKVGLTPTARLRRARFHEAVRDGRGTENSFRIASRSATW